MLRVVAKPVNRKKKCMEKYYYYLGMESLVKSFREKEREYLIVDHELNAGEYVPADVHGSNEWIFFSKGRGKFEIIMEGEIAEIELDSERTMAISIPACSEHSLRAITDLSYTVLRDGFD